MAIGLNRRSCISIGHSVCEKPKDIIQIVSHLNECFKIAILITMLTLFNLSNFTALDAHINNKWLFCESRGQNI